MKSVLLTSNSDSDLELLLQIAHKIGVGTKVLSEEAAEDLAMASAIEKGETGEHINVEEFLKELKK